MKKAYIGILVTFILLFQLFFYVYPLSGFSVSEDQLQVVENINRHLQNERTNLSFRLINPEENWDKVCIVLPYSYESYFSPYSELKKYYGEKYNKNRLFVPDTNKETFGIGFAFIQNGILIHFVHIPKTTFSLSLTQWIDVKPIGFTVQSKFIPIGSLTYKTENNSKCFTKDKASFSISNDKIFSVEGE